MRCCIEEELKKCKDAVTKLKDNLSILARQLRKYDPHEDMLSHWARTKRGFTIPGGHYTKMFNLFQGCAKSMLTIFHCLGCDNFPSSPQPDYKPLEDFRGLPVPKYWKPQPYYVPIVVSPKPPLFIRIFDRIFASFLYLFRRQYFIRNLFITANQKIQQ